jgi:hypothetical protein
MRWRQRSEFFNPKLRMIEHTIRIFTILYILDHALNALLSIISSGPLVKRPTITDFEFAIIPDDKKGTPPLMVNGST